MFHVKHLSHGLYYSISQNKSKQLNLLRNEKMPPSDEGGGSRSETEGEKRFKLIVALLFLSLSQLR